MAMVRVGLMGIDARARVLIEEWSREHAVAPAFFVIEAEPCSDELRAFDCFVVDATDRPLLAVAACGKARASAPALRLALMAPRNPELEAAAQRVGALCLPSCSLQEELPWRELHCFVYARAGSRADACSHASGRRIRIDRRGRRLYVEGVERAISSTKFDLLCYFIDHAGRAVSARELVRENLLLPSQSARFKSIILELRSLLGRERDCIRAVPGYGYRLDLEDESPPA